MLLCLLSLNLQGQGRQQIAEIVRVERPKTPTSKKSKQAIRQNKKLKRQQARFQRKRKANKQFKTNWKEQKTNKNRAWNLMLTLGIIGFGVLIFGPFVVLGLFGLVTLLGTSAWAIVMGVFIFLISLIISTTPIVAPILTIVGLGKLKEEGGEWDGFDWTYFWAVFSAITIVISFLGIGIFLGILAGWLSGFVFTIVGLTILFLFLGSIALFFVSLEKLRSRIDTNESPKIRFGGND